MSNKRAEEFDLLDALGQIEKEKNISKESIMEAIESSMLETLKKRLQVEDNIDVKINPEYGRIDVTLKKEVVKTVSNPNTEISLEKAHQY